MPGLPETLEEVHEEITTLLNDALFWQDDVERAAQNSALVSLKADALSGPIALENTDRASAMATCKKGNKSQTEKKAKSGRIHTPSEKALVGFVSAGSSDRAPSVVPEKTEKARPVFTLLAFEAGDLCGRLIRLAHACCRLESRLVSVKAHFSRVAREPIEVDGIVGVNYHEVVLKTVIRLILAATTSRAIAVQVRKSGGNEARTWRLLQNALTLKRARSFSARDFLVEAVRANPLAWLHAVRPCYIGYEKLAAGLEQEWAKVQFQYISEKCKDLRRDGEIPQQEKPVQETTASSAPRVTPKARRMPRRPRIELREQPRRVLIDGKPLRVSGYVLDDLYKLLANANTGIPVDVKAYRMKEVKKALRSHGQTRLAKRLRCRRIRNTGYVVDLPNVKVLRPRP